MNIKQQRIEEIFARNNDGHYIVGFWSKDEFYPIALFNFFADAAYAAEKGSDFRTVEVELWARWREKPEYIFHMGKEIKQ